MYKGGDFRYCGGVFFKIYLGGGVLHSDGENDFMAVSHDFSEELGEFVPAELLFGGFADETDGFGGCFAVFGGGLFRDGPVVIVGLVIDVCELDPPDDGDEIQKEWMSPYITIL